MRSRLRRTAYALVCLFWALEIAELTLVSIIQEGSAFWPTMAPRTIVAIFGVLVFGTQVEVVVRTLDLRQSLRFLAIALAALIGWALIFCCNYVAFTISFPDQKGAALQDYVYPGFSLSWFCLALLGSILVVAYIFEGREQERRLSEIEASARDARLAALRYQLNPHFLFNAMNSIASLINARLNDKAECMVEALSDFLRSTLEMDPVDDIPLQREIELQALYLSIEEVRFPDRLRTRYDIPADLASVLVPALIIQPLVENSVRHAVANSTELVTIVIRARRVGTSVEITVADDGRVPPGSSRTGTGIGTANVRSRLENRYGADQMMTAGWTPDGYRSTILFPAGVSA